jgi:hypothetical protein
LITGLLGLSEGDPRCGREIARRASEGYDNQRQRKNSNFHNITLLRKMSDKLPACRRLPESPFAGILDKLEACRTLRGALFILSGRRDRHDGSSGDEFVIPPLGFKRLPQIHFRISNTSALRRDYKPENTYKY